MGALTLIGTGAHGTDIAQTLTRDFDWIDHHSHFVHNKSEVIIGINEPRTRHAVATALNIRDLRWIHPDALVPVSCSIDFGTHINYAVSMVRTKIGLHTTIGPGVTIAGDVQIGSRVLIGAGSTICDRVTIDSDTIIGAGSTVLPETHLLAGTYVGTPAVRIR